MPLAKGQWGIIKIVKLVVQAPGVRTSTARGVILTVCCTLKVCITTKMDSFLPCTPWCQRSMGPIIVIRCRTPPLVSQKNLQDDPYLSLRVDA